MQKFSVNHKYFKESYITLICVYTTCAEEDYMISICMAQIFQTVHCSVQQLLFWLYNIPHRQILFEIQKATIMITSKAMMLCGTNV